MMKYKERIQKMFDDDVLQIVRIISTIANTIVRVIDFLERRKNKHQKSSFTDQS